MLLLLLIQTNETLSHMRLNGNKMGYKGRDVFCLDVAIFILTEYIKSCMYNNVAFTIVTDQ